MTTWVLLRGLGREARHWGRFATVLQQQLPTGDRVLALDLPGNGRWCQRSSPVQVEAMVAAARAESQALGIAGPCMLVALSLGGMVAAGWASSAPHEVRGCVLVNSSMAALSPFWQRLRPACYPRLLQCLAAGPGWRREAAVYRMTSNLPLDRAVVELLLVDGFDVVVGDLAVDVDQRPDERVVVVAPGQRPREGERERADEDEAEGPGEAFAIDHGYRRSTTFRRREIQGRVIVVGVAGAARGVTRAICGRGPCR